MGGSVRRQSSLAAVALAFALAAAVSACDGSGSGSTTTSASTTGPPPAATAAQHAAYERRLVAALAGAAGAGGLARQVDRAASAEANARVFDRARTLYQRAYEGVRTVRAPADVADLHGGVVGSLRALAGQAGRASTALRGRRSAELKAALAGLSAEGVRLQGLAGQLRARGY